MKESRYRVTGMGCESCVTRVKKAVTALDGTEHVDIDAATDTLTVEYDEKRVSFDRLKDAVKQAGYGLEEI